MRGWAPLGTRLLLAEASWATPTEFGVDRLVGQMGGFVVRLCWG